MFHKVHEGGNLPGVVFATMFTGTYIEEAQDLISTLEKFDLSYHIEEWPSGGSWKANNFQRFLFLQEQFDRYPDKAVVWTDADSRVLQLPVLLQSYVDRGGIDIAAHVYRRPDDRPYYIVTRKGKYYCHRRQEMYHGTCYYGPGAARKEFLTDVLHWISMEPTLHARSQPYVDDVLYRWWGSFQKFTFVEMPRNYAQVFDTPRIDGEPVILHRQSGRVHKPTVNKDSAPFWKCPGWKRGMRINKALIRRLVGTDGS